MWDTKTGLWATSLSGLPANELHRQQSPRLKFSTQWRKHDSLQELQHELVRCHVTTFTHQVVGQQEFCSSMGTSCCQGATGATAQQDRALPEGCLWQLLHNGSENQQLFGTVHLIMPKWSCDGIPRQLSHCHGLELSPSHTSSGFLKEVQLLSSLKCVEAPGLNGREGELASSTFPLFANGLCLKTIQEQGGIFVTL